MSKDNLKLWHSVCITDPKHTKKVKIGARNYTSISPQYQLKKATEAFGLYGEKWGLKVTNFSIIDLPDEMKLLRLDAVFFAPNVEFPINSSMMLGEWKDKKNYNTKEIEKKYIVDTDTYKKLETDVTTKALSKLGFNADVFMGKFDDSAYTDTAQKMEEYTSKLGLEGLVAELSTITTSKALTAYYIANRWISTDNAAAQIFNEKRKSMAPIKK